MRNAYVAEWLVARWTDKRRAASIVGDLVELAPLKGPMWFWLSVARIIVSLSWRGAVASVALVYTFSWGYFGLQMAISGIHAQHRPPDGYLWTYAFIVLMALAVFSWMTLLYSAICYGPRDKVTEVALVLAVLITGPTYYWWQPIILTVCAALGVCAVTASLAHRKYRRPAIAVIATVAITFATYPLLCFLSNQYQHFICPSLIGDKELREHPSLIWMSIAMFFTLARLIAIVCSRTRRWSMREDQLDPIIEG